jgi:Ankyrin repeats (many copies)/Ankyrin repeat
LEDVDEAKREHAHRLFQCVTVASRPLRVEELAAFLAFNFEAGSIPTFEVDWCPEDATWAIASACSSLISIVKLRGSDVVQFSHFSVKEFLISSRLAITKDSIPHYPLLLEPAHTMVAQACLGALLRVDEHVTRASLERFPLAQYAADHWADHAKFKNVSPSVLDGMKALFDPSKPHFAIWAWISGSIGRRFQSSSKPVQTPLHYAALYGICDVVDFLVVEHSQDVNDRGHFGGMTPLGIASERGCTEFARILLQHGADANARDYNNNTPLHQASQGGHLEIVQLLLSHGADTTACDNYNQTPLHRASLGNTYS